ncbi:MAG: hypothetical protein Q9197_004931 [Variospora fuerteventurae]
MARPATPPILSELRSSTSPATQVAALRALKHEIIGHEQKKRLWVGRGVLVPIARILNTSKGNGKRRDVSDKATTHRCRPPFVRTEEEEARLQAVVIVGSLAHGGPSYIPPIRAGAVIAPILSLLSTTESSVNTVLAALRTLNTVADAAALSPLEANSRDTALFHSLFTDETLTSIARLLSQDPNSQYGQQQISLAAALIGKTCRDGNQRTLLVQAGVLEALASNLAAFVDISDLAASSSDVPCASLGLPRIASSSTQSQMAPVLAAIGAIIDTSRSRALHLLSSPALTAVLLRLEADLTVPQERKASMRGHSGSVPIGTRPSSSRLECLLPQIPSFAPKGTMHETSGHPPFGGISTPTRQPYTARALQHTHEIVHGPAIGPPHGEESPLVAWLMYLARVSSGLTRLLAAWIVSLLHDSGLVDKRRDLSFAMLLVPLLVRLLERGSMSAADDHSVHGANPIQPVNLTSQQQAPSVLATLLIDSIDSQRAAVDAGAIKKLVQLLKETYNPIPEDANPSPWAAEHRIGDEPDGSHDNLFVGDSVNISSACEVAKVREAVLNALASLASIRDEHRKSIIENGVVPFVVESLKPFHKFPTGSPGDGKVGVAPQNSSQAQNSSGVILAACGATRSLSRSVTTLRTSLMDAGVAAPLFVLLKHHDSNVQVAATSVISNLVLEFSPMREAILEAGVLKTLCDHARSMDPSLRLSSVWALKHLILSAPKQLKRDCLGELGPGWLKQIICHDVDDLISASASRSDRESTLGAPLAMGTPNAAGEQVDLLNATDGSREGFGVVNENEEVDSEMVDSIGVPSRPQLEAELWNQLQSAQGASGRRDVGTTNQSRADGLAVQKEGLDFIRNLICGNDSREMIDCLFEELGQDKVFEILTSKLRPRLTNAFNRDRRSLDYNIRQTPPQTDIVTSVCYIVVHLAAGLPRHRQLLIAQTELLKLLLAHFAHPSHEVRSACAWIVINLTWMDDQSDHSSCKERAQELNKMGWVGQLKVLELDPELDVRERVKTALHQIQCALR